MQTILNEIRELNREYPEGLIAIGGVAVYLHVVSNQALRPETTHVIDFYLSMLHLGSLRDREELTPNPKLHKHQIIRHGIEMDVYVERQNRLALPYEDIARSSEVIDGVRVAAKEHLLVLKIDAGISRSGSGKGAKDKKDLANLIIVTDQPRAALLQPTMDSDRMDFIRDLGRQSEPFADIAGGNSHKAASLRKIFKTNLDSIERAVREISREEPRLRLNSTHRNDDRGDRGRGR